jgi:hypothetical protein
MWMRLIWQILVFKNKQKRSTDMVKKWFFGKISILAALALAGALAPQSAAAHCDGLDGPVVNEARVTLEKGDVTPVLKWVMPEHEEMVRTAFDQARKVRTLGVEARNLADMYFFETLVRLHREGEGAAYTGLKPAGMIEAPILKADQALTDGSVEHLADAISNHVGKAMRERFSRALAAKKGADENVAAGREFVEAYVEYVHFVEGIVGLVHGSHAH